MGMGANNKGGASVDMMADRLLLARRLGVEINDDNIGLLAQWAGCQFPVNRGERIVKRIHEDPSQRVNHQNADTVPGCEQAGATPRRAGGIIERPQEPLLAIGKDKSIALVEGMIAGGNHVRAAADDGIEDFFRYAETTGGVLAVHDDKIEPIIGDQGRQFFDDCTATAAANEIAQKQKTHTGSVLGCPEL